MAEIAMYPWSVANDNQSTSYIYTNIRTCGSQVWKMWNQQSPVSKPNAAESASPASPPSAKSLVVPYCTAQKSSRSNLPPTAGPGRQTHSRKGPLVQRTSPLSIDRSIDVAARGTTDFLTVVRVTMVTSRISKRLKTNRRFGMHRRLIGKTIVRYGCHGFRLGVRGSGIVNVPQSTILRSHPWLLVIGGMSSLAVGKARAPGWSEFVRFEEPLWQVSWVACFGKMIGFHCSREARFLSRRSVWIVLLIG